MLASLVIAAQLFAASTAQMDDPFMDAFSQTCLQYAFKQSELGAAMEKRGVGLLSANASRPFTGGRPGKAWGLTHHGRQYVLVVGDNNSCSVIAKDADIAAVTEDFVRTVSKPAPPLVSKELRGGPSGAGLHTTNFSWSRPSDEVQLLFILTTSSDSRTLARAMATVSLTKKDATQSQTPGNSQERSREQ